ncbi:hypothetical protein D3C84_1253270 [compost metagenome]
MDIFGSHIRRLEDFLEVLVSDSGKVRTVFWSDTEHYSIGGQRFTFAHGHVFGKLVHHAVHGEPGFTTVGQRRVGRAAIGA